MSYSTVSQGLQGVVGLHFHFNAVMRGRWELETKHRLSSTELKDAHDDVGKTVAQCDEAVNRAERVEACSSKFEAFVLEISRLMAENKELKTSKLFALDKIRELEGKVESLTEEAAQVEVSTRAFTLDRSIGGP